MSGLGENERQMENHPLGELCGGEAFIILVGSLSPPPLCMGPILCAGTVLGFSRMLLACTDRINMMLLSSLRRCWGRG